MMPRARNIAPISPIERTIRFLRLVLGIGSFSDFFSEPWAVVLEKKIAHDHDYK